VTQSPILAVTFFLNGGVQSHFTYFSMVTSGSSTHITLTLALSETFNEPSFIMISDGSYTFTSSSGDTRR